MNIHCKRVVTVGEMPMNHEVLSDALLRKFLLGKVDDEERVQIESLFLIHREAKKRVLNAEQDLIEDYLENSLTPSDREIFLSMYARTAAQRQSLRITKSIKECGVMEAALLQTGPATITGRSDFLERLLSRPVLLIPFGVTIAIVVVIALVWLNSRMPHDRLVVEQELARLNAPASLREVSPQMVSLDLSPLTLRSAERQVQLKTGAGVQIVELRLPWFQKEDSSAYVAEIRRLDDDESFTIRNVPLESDGRYSTRIRVPAKILRPGQYQIRLSVIAVNGETDLAEEYQFTVAG